MDQLLLKAIFLSLSFHSPNVPGTTFDWRIGAGVTGKQSHYEVLSERQGGERYYGLELSQGYMFENEWIGEYYFEGEIFKRTSKNIDTEKFATYWPADGMLQFGEITTLDRWANHQQREAIRLNLWWGFHGVIEGNSIKRRSATRLSYSATLMEKEYDRFKTQIEPRIIYRKEKDVEYWSIDLRLLFSRTKPKSHK